MRAEASAPDTARPSRTYTKRNTTAFLVFCCACIAVSMSGYIPRWAGEMVIPMAFISAMSALGIYQAVGHFDLRATRKPLRTARHSGES